MGKADAPGPAEPPTAPAGIVHADTSGYLLAVHADGLFDLAEERRMTVRMEPPIGGFVLEGEALVSIWPKSAVDAGLITSVRESFMLGQERTPEQDAELGIIVIADMAVRALSPGINDPTTAMLCIDRLSEILARLGGVEEPVPVRIGEDGSVRLFTRLTTFDRAVSLSFDQIRFFGAENPSIAKKLLDALRRLGALVPAAHRRPLLDQAEQTLEQVRRSAPPDGDLRSIERLAAECLAALRDGTPPPDEGAAPGTQRQALTHR